MNGNDCLLLQESKSKFNQNGKKMKKLGKILMLAMALVLIASCGQGAGKSGEQTTPDPDKLMDELLVAGRAGDWQKVLELDEKINEQKMTTKQAFRFFNEIQPKYTALGYEGGEQGDWWDENGTMYEEQDVVAEQPQPTYSQPQKTYREPEYLYYCKFCRTLARATEWTKPGPNSGRCTQGYHGWMKVCEYGTQHGFRCSKCGLEVTTNSRPYQGNSCTQGEHQWKQLY